MTLLTGLARSDFIDRCDLKRGPRESLRCQTGRAFSNIKNCHLRRFGRIRSSLYGNR